MLRGRVTIALAAAILAVALVSSCGPVGPDALRDETADRRLDDRYNEEQHQAILEYLDRSIVEPQHGGRVFSAYHIMASSSNRIYVWAVCQEYSKGANRDLKIGTGTSLPVALMVEVRDGLLYVTGYKRPRDGSLYPGNLRGLFPAVVQDQIARIHQGDVVRELQGRCESRAREQFGLGPRPPEWRFLVDGSEPKPKYAALLKAEVHRYPKVDLVSPDGRYILAHDGGLVALPLFTGGSPVHLYQAEPTLSFDDMAVIRPIGWTSDTGCLFVTMGLQKNGPHKGSRGAALFSGDVLNGEATELVYFDYPHNNSKAVTWDAASRKVYLHVHTAIWEMDITQNTARELRHDLPSYDGLFWAIPSPDGTKFAYNRCLPGKTALTVLDNRTGKETSIHTDGDSHSFSPLWSPDSRYLVAYFAGRKPAAGSDTPGQFDVLPDEDGPFPTAKGLVVYDTVTGSASIFQVEGKWLMSPTWSPDSGTLFFASASILVDPTHSASEAKKVVYDSVWGVSPGSASSLEKVTDLPSAYGLTEYRYSNASIISALPGGQGVLLETQGTDGPSLWRAVRGKSPVKLAAGGSHCLQTTVSQPDGSMAIVTSVDGDYEVWLLRSGECGIVATKVVDLGNVPRAEVMAYTGDWLVMRLGSSEPEVSAIAVYDTGSRAVHKSP